MNYLPHLFFYLYAAALVGATGYVVFYLHHIGWWFVLTAFFVAIGIVPLNNTVVIDTHPES